MRLRFCRPARILSIALLGVLCFAFPIPGRSHICGLHFDCERVTPPKLTKALAIRVAEEYLAQNPPVVRFALQRPVGTRPPAGYTDLSRAGLLRVLYGKPGQGSGPVYGLPDNWERNIILGVYRFTQVNTGNATVKNFIELPAGQFRYVPGSAVLTQQTFAAGDGIFVTQRTVTFKYRFVSTADTARLLRLGPAKDWTVANYRHPQSDLRQIGHVATRTLWLRPCHAGWLTAESPASLACP